MKNEFFLNFKNRISSVRTNLRGKYLKNKYVIIESDDWGSIRTPSFECLNKYEKKGISLNNSDYKYDSIENNSDVERLFEVLDSVKDFKGNPAKITANSIMANPNFDRIKKDKFKKYHFEKFTDTYKKNKNCNNVLNLFFEGIENNLFYPQFHGREHLNINRWLKDLQDNVDNTHFSFKLKSTYSGIDDYSYMEAFDWNSPDEIIQQKNIIKEGLEIFYDTFKFKSISFIPPCYNLDPKLYNFLSDLGIKILQGIRVQLVPTGKFNIYKKQSHFFGEKHSSGLMFNVRNVFFEPSLDQNINLINNCLSNISTAFLLGKPAVISTHRINYISSINEKNGTFGLNSLKKLLKEILKKWPDVEFISTNELYNIIKE